MIPVYSLSPRTLSLLASVSERIGEVHAAHLHHPSPLLRRAHRASTIHATLALEDNPLDRATIAQLLLGNTTEGSNAAELEVLNTMRLYDLLPTLNPFLSQDLRHAHGELMHGLALEPGRYRTGDLEIIYGNRPGSRKATGRNISSQVEQLLHFAENDEGPLLISSCVLHYGLVHIRPFTAGNGRIARIWQKLLLLRQWPVFAYLPLEGFIQRSRTGYYAALEHADRQEDCGGFITFMLERIDEALHELLSRERPILNAPDRLSTFLLGKNMHRFTRKDYRRAFPELSPATASRDLAKGVTSGTIECQGTGRVAWYSSADQ
ncbi:MAG: Fic family protein [Flavobacteriales bacterium]